MAQQVIVAEKVGMTQKWVDDRVVPVTVLRVEPMRVVQIKTTERDGYTALQVTYGHRDAKKLNKPEAGHFSKADVAPGKRLVELRLDSVDGYEVGQELTVEVLVAGTKVDVTAVSRGKGFAGTMKRRQLQGPGRQPRQPQEPPGTRRDRFVRLPRSRVQGHEDVRPHGQRAGHDAQPRGRRGRRRAQRAARQGSVPGPNGGVVVVRNAVKAAVKGA